MAEEVTEKIIKIGVVGTESLRALKNEIIGLKKDLRETDANSEKYEQTLTELVSKETELTQAMAQNRNGINSAANSYNELQEKMTALRRVWREVNDEATRNEIGKQINSINNQLKEMDASIGVFNRNVGDYKNSIVDASKLILANLAMISPELGKIGSEVAALIPLITHTIQVVTKGMTGIKAALVSTGIGTLIVLVGLLVQNWDKFTEILGRWIPSMRQANAETKAQIEADNQLLEVNKKVTAEIDYQARVMQAQGATTLQILAYKKAETQALLDNTTAQIRETKAKIASLEAHGWLQRLLHGENKQIKELQASLENLKNEQESLQNTVTRLGQDITIETITIKNQGNEAESAATQVNKLADAMKALQEAERKADAERQRRLKEQEELNKFSEELTKEYYDDLVEFDTTYIDTLIANRQREEELMKERQESYFKLAGSVQSVMGSIADAWENSVQAQLDAGEISEEEAEKQFEQIKAIQTAEAIINTIAGAVGAFMGITKDTGGWGIAAAIAEAVAIMTAGMAQVAKIQSTTIGSKSVSSQFGSGAISTPQTVEYTPQYTQNITNQTETDNLANALATTPIRAYVVESDISKSQKRVQQRNAESTF